MQALNEWFENLLARPALVFPGAVVSVGERIVHLGPRRDFAKVRIRFEPAEELSLSVANGVALDFAKSALMGVVDVLLTERGFPVLKVSVVVEDIEIDLIDSNEMAFRLAGRDAARKALNQKD